MQNFNCSLRKKIDGDNSGIALRLLDPFNTNTFRIKVGTATSPSSPSGPRACGACS
ncbi:MAG: hypothetical protein ABJE47_05860 [bacterium]